MWQGCWYIPDCSCNAESLWGWRGSADSWSNREYQPFWEDPYWMGGEHHRLPPQEQGRHPWARKLSRPQIARPGHDDLRKGGWEQQQVRIDNMQFGLMPGRSTTDAIFIVRQLQENFHAINKTLYMAFVNLENAFHRLSRLVIWWALRRLGIDEWLVQLIQGMYENARSRVHVGCNLSEESSVKVGVHQGSWLSPLLFIMVLEAFSQEFCIGYPGETCIQMTWLW